MGGGYGATPLTGTCLAQLKAQGFTHGNVVSVVSSDYHGLTETSGNLLRALLFGFLAAPRSSSLIKELGSNTGPDKAEPCTSQSQDGGLRYAVCSELGPGGLVPGTEMPECAWQGYDYHVEYYLPDTLHPASPESNAASSTAPLSCLTLVVSAVAFMLVCVGARRVRRPGRALLRTA